MMSSDERQEHMRVALPGAAGYLLGEAKSNGPKIARHYVDLPDFKGLITIYKESGHWTTKWNQGGDTISLVRWCLGCSRMDALRWLWKRGLIPAEIGIAEKQHFI